VGARINANPCLSSDAGLPRPWPRPAFFERAIARIIAATPGFAR
jgi:hypothetical protein